MKVLSPTVFGCILLLFTSCQDVIDLSLPDPEPALVVEGHVNNLDTVQTVKLSSLENYFASGAPNYKLYKNATVRFFENNILINSMNYVENTSQFELVHQATTGNEYHIEISLPNGESYKSKPELVDQIPVIDSLFYVKGEVPGVPATTFSDYNVLLNTKEFAGVGDYYQWKVYVNGAYQDEPFDLNFNDDRFVDGQDIYFLPVFGMSQEEFEEFKKESPTGQVFVTVEQLKISQGLFDFLSLVFQQTAIVGSPFSSPPAEIKGNVEMLNNQNKTALGYFYGASLDRKTIEILE